MSAINMPALKTVWRKLLAVVAITVLSVASLAGVANAQDTPEPPDTATPESVEECLKTVREAVEQAQFGSNAGSTPSAETGEVSYEFSRELYGYLCEGGGDYTFVDDASGDTDTTSITNISPEPSAGPTTSAGPATEPPTARGDRGADPGFSA